MKKIVIVLMMLMPVFMVQAVEASSKPKAAWQLAGVPDFKSMTNVRVKKDKFFRYLLPLVVAENARIMKDRERLLALQKKKNSLSGADKWWLKTIGKAYHLEEVTAANWFKEILARVDVIPPSLAMAQASYESGWGTSRFARNGNNWFGVMCFTKGCGFVPRARNAGAARELAKYKTVKGSVKAYILNLNSHRTYASMRAIRTKLRASGKVISGRELTRGLSKYSVRGAAYIKEIQGMIRVNKLAQFDAKPTSAKIPG